MHRGDIMMHVGAYYDACEIPRVHQGMLSTLGNTMSTAGDIMSTSGDIQYIRGIS